MEIREFTQHLRNPKIEKHRNKITWGTASTNQQFNALPGLDDVSKHKAMIFHKTLLVYACLSGIKHVCMIQNHEQKKSVALSCLYDVYMYEINMKS